MSETTNKTYEIQKSIVQRTEDDHYPGGLVKPTDGTPMFPTWFLVVFLILCFFVLKGFIYLKDKKRHGK